MKAPDRKHRVTHPHELLMSTIRGGGKMSKRLHSPFLVVGVPLATALVAASASNLLAAGPLHSALHIRPGLWEFNSSGKVIGDTVFRDALLAGVPEAQRAQHLAWLRQQISQPSKERECLSEAGFERQISSLGTGCKQSVVSNTGSRFEVLTQCVAEDHGWKDVTSSRTVATATTSTTSEHGVSSKAGKTMTRDTVESGHWISSSCGNIHGIQIL